MLLKNSLWCVSLSWNSTTILLSSIVLTSPTLLYTKNLYEKWSGLEAGWKVGCKRTSACTTLGLDVCTVPPCSLKGDTGLLLPRSPPGSPARMVDFSCIKWPSSSLRKPVDCWILLMLKLLSSSSSSALKSSSSSSWESSSFSWFEAWLAIPPPDLEVTSVRALQCPWLSAKLTYNILLAK